MRHYVVTIILTGILLLSGCSTVVNVKPEEFPEDKDVFISGVGLKTIISGVTLEDDSTVIFDSTGAIFYSGPKEIHGRTYEGDSAVVKLENSRYVHVASCDTTQCVSKSMDVATFYDKALKWPVTSSNSGRVPTLELVKFDEDGADFDRESGRITARTHYGDQDVEFWVDHIGYLRISSLEQGALSREIGLRGGSKLTNLHGGESAIATVDNSTGSSFCFGIVGRQWMRSWLNVQGEVNLVRRNAERTRTVTVADTTFHTRDKFRLTYLDIPVLARVHLANIGPSATHVYFGPYLAVELEAMTDFDSTQSYVGITEGAWGTVEITNSNSAVWGVALGGDIEYPIMGLNAWLDIRYMIGLSSFTGKWQDPSNLANGTRALIDETGNSLDLKTNELTLSVGVSFPY